jgi:hypothetical protein
LESREKATFRYDRMAASGRNLKSHSAPQHPRLNVSNVVPAISVNAVLVRSLPDSDRCTAPVGGGSADKAEGRSLLMRRNNRPLMRLPKVIKSL